MTKRELAWARRTARRIERQHRRALRMRELRCFWSWPLGHVRDAAHVCLNCGHDASAPAAREFAPVYAARPPQV